MKNLVIRDNEAHLDKSGECVDTSNVYNNNFLNEVNLASSSVVGSSDYLNEIFLYFYVPLLEKLATLREKEIRKVFFESFSGSEAVSWLAAAIKGKYDFPYLYKVLFTLKAAWSFVYSFIVTVVYSLLLPIYILVKYRGTTYRKVSAITVIRAPATLSKMRFLESEGVEFFFDDLSFKKCDGKSIYAASFFARVKGIFCVPFYSIRDFFQVYSEARSLLGFLVACESLRYYKKRIPHKSNFEFYFRSLLKHTKPEVLYTGNKEDRFALLEKRLVKKLALKCVCMPHGLEYSYRMPAGVVGDVFYCTTLTAKNYLQNIYRGFSTRFIFDDAVVHKMLAKDFNNHSEKRVVFFPESREPEKNLSIIRNLHEFGCQFFVKLHIKDKLENYAPYVTEELLITDFDEAISNNICIARKSTVLLEAIHNGSISIAVLVDEKDRKFVEQMFPSLTDAAILKVDTFDKLYNILLKQGVVGA